MTGPVRIAVVDYGVGNLRSAEKAFQHFGADARLTTDPADIDAADGVVVPGVGAFAGCVRALDDAGLTAVVTAAASAARDGAGVPFLGICVGMQLLYERSEENPEVAGLGVLPGTVRALDPGVKSPQMQWNRLDLDEPDHPLFAGLEPESWCYFVHGFAAPVADGTIAHCEYGGTVCAAVGAGALVATQFHPEKSGPIGLRILANFAEMCAREPVG